MLRWLGRRKLMSLTRMFPQFIIIILEVESDRMHEDAERRHCDEGEDVEQQNTSMEAPALMKTSAVFSCRNLSRKIIKAKRCA